MHKKAISNVPLVCVFRSADRKQYLFMEMAQVNSGSYVSWGELRIMTHEEASREARSFVIQSLRTFKERNGQHKHGRLKLKGYGRLLPEYDLVDIKLISPTLLELIPTRRSPAAHERLGDLRSTLALDVPADEFLAQLDAALLRGHNSGLPIAQDR